MSNTAKGVAMRMSMKPGEFSKEKKGKTGSRNGPENFKGMGVSQTTSAIVEKHHGEKKGQDPRQ